MPKLNSTDAKHVLDSAERLFSAATRISMIDFKTNLTWAGHSSYASIQLNTSLSQALEQVIARIDDKGPAEAAKECYTLWLDLRSGNIEGGTKLMAPESYEALGRVLDKFSDTELLLSDTPYSPWLLIPDALYRLDLEAFPEDKLTTPFVLGGILMYLLLLVEYSLITLPSNRQWQYLKASEHCGQVMHLTQQLMAIARLMVYR